MTSPLQDLSDLQWLKYDNNVLAAQHGLKPNHVAAYRRIHGKPKGPRSPGSGRPSKYDLSQIDWSLSNAENAAKLGCTTEYVSQLRRAKQKAEDFA